MEWTTNCRLSAIEGHAWLTYLGLQNNVYNLCMSIIPALFAELFYCTCFSFSSKSKCIDFLESILCVLLYFNFQGKQQRVRGIARLQESKGASLVGLQHQPLGFFQEAEWHPSCAFDFELFSDILKRSKNNSLLLLWHLNFWCYYLLHLFLNLLLAYVNVYI